MKVIGVTGGVGSGKSVVLSILEKDYHAETILADLVAHDLMQPGGKSYEDIVEAFGDGILNDDGTIDRVKLGNIVFHDAEKLQKLNAITHPNVKEEIIPSVIDAWVKKEEECSDLIQPFPGIEALLTQLRDAGTGLGIVTSRTHSELELVFRPFSLLRFFSVIICADDTSEHKPSPAPLLKYMEKAGAGPEQVLYVGDSAQDMECAGRAGTAGALAVWGTRNHEIPATYYPAHPLDLGRLILS